MKPEQFADHLKEILKILGETMIFLIKKLWTDSLENNFADAHGYEILGYVLIEEDAKKIVNDAGKFSISNMDWILERLNNGQPVNRLCYEAVEYFI